jgi:tRNA modification GTPase
MTAGADSGPFEFSDTIAALATVSGRGALALVRLSGVRAHNIARAVADRWPPAPRTATLTTIRSGDRTPLDQAVLVRYDAPASFTGEDAVEFSTHGGLVVPATVLAALVAHGARLALPGEFTRRAVLNGKLDILQAEAAGDLVDARSRAAQRAAMQQLDGGLTRRILALRDSVVGLEALIAYDIDFPEEDDGPVPPARILAGADETIDALDHLLATARTGELVREGALVVLAGAPNVGKSSLFNALLGQRRAIVTPMPGTTRDAIEAVIDTPSVPLRLVDTAGLRDAVDPVERLGVEVSESYLARASVVLACADDHLNLDAVASAVLERIGASIIVVHTKSDLTPLDGEFTARASAAGAERVVAVSVETGDGLAEVMDAVLAAIARRAGTPDMDAPMLTAERHRYGVTRALEEVRAFRERWRTGSIPAPVAAVHLRDAATALEDLIGVVDVEDVLDEVFRRFCVGK